VGYVGMIGCRESSVLVGGRVVSCMGLSTRCREGWGAERVKCNRGYVRVVVM
jgi:hypothetical protein